MGVGGAGEVVNSFNDYNISRLLTFYTTFGRHRDICFIELFKIKIVQNEIHNNVLKDKV